MIKQWRYALYYMPEPGSALADFGAKVLCVDPSPDSKGFDRQELETITSEPRVYGFHATLKAPMRLAPGAVEGDLLPACAELAAHRAPIVVGPLDVALIGDFIALVPREPPAALGLFAAECVAALDHLRAPLAPAERERRRPDSLDPRRRALLDRWGYPHVFETFRFHMTLTGRLDADQRDLWLARLSRAFPEIELVIDAVTVLCQDDAEPFRVLRRIPFTP